MSKSAVLHLARTATFAGASLGAVWSLMLTWLAPDAGAGNTLILGGLYLLLYGAFWSMVVVALGVGASLVDRMPTSPSAPAVVVAIVVAAAAVMVPGVVRFVIPRTPPATLPTLPNPDRTVHVIAVDGLDPGMLSELIDGGTLPNFASLAKRGVWLDIDPLSGKSPELWTAYVTGRKPEDHGIQGFTSRYLASTSIRLPTTDLDFVGARLAQLDERFVQKRGLTSTQRRVPAIWNLISRIGGSSLVINWWATEPAESIAGTMISPAAFPRSREAAAAYPGAPPAAGSIWPADVALFVHRRTSEVLADNPVSDRVELYRARDLAAWDIYLDLCRSSHSLCLVYQRTIDVSSHVYSREVFGEDAEPGIDSRARFEALVVRAYRDIDARLGEVIARLPEEDDLVVLSDHGWRYDGSDHVLSLPDAEGTLRWPPGVMLLQGPSFVPGARATLAATLDVFPTLATLLGLPLSEELPGRPLDVFVADFPASAETVPTYGGRDSSVGADSLGQSSLDQLEELHALGYIQ